jgi:hypothetical protein
MLILAQAEKIIRADFAGQTEPLRAETKPFASHTDEDYPQTVRSRNQSTSANWSRTRFVRDRGPAKNHLRRCIAVSILPPIQFLIHVQIIPAHVLI